VLTEWKRLSDTRRTKAIIPVHLIHLYGNCADMAAVGAIAAKDFPPVGRNPLCPPDASGEQGTDS
jgi:hypothetical protein